VLRKTESNQSIHLFLQSIRMYIVDLIITDRAHIDSQSAMKHVDEGSGSPDSLSYHVHRGWQTCDYSEEYEPRSRCLERNEVLSRLLRV